MGGLLAVLPWTALDVGSPLVYHRSVEGSFEDEFGAWGFQEWRADVEQRGSLEGLRTSLTDGVVIESLYAEPPTRLPIGVPTREGRWQIYQEVDDPRMEVAAEQARDDLAGGGDGVWLVAGLDHGTRVLTPGDLATVLAHVDLARFGVELEAEGDALALAMSLVAVAEARGVEPARLRGGFGADPLGALARGGVLTSGLRGARRDLIELAAFSSERCPQVRAALVSTRAYHGAGATPTQEIAWAVATGVEYLRWLGEAGFAVEGGLAELRFAVSVGPDLFGEVAKLRALRWVWAKAMAAAGVTAEGRRMVLHARSSLAHRARVDPWTNMLRGAGEVFSAAVGGADSCSLLPFDAALGPSDAMARRVARNTQLVLREESHLHAVDDPAAGSWTLEAMTEAFAREAWSIFREIEGGGGMAKALLRGRISEALDRRREELRAEVARGQRALVGVNAFATLAGRAVERAAVDLDDVEVELGNRFGEATPEERHEAALLLVQTLRDRTAPPGALARSTHALCRLGMDVYSLRNLLSVSMASLYLAPLEVFRSAAPWEELREAADRYAATTGRLRAFLATLGTPAEHQARVHWVTQLLAAVGVEAQSEAGVTDPESAVAAMSESDAPVAVICGPDTRYPGEVPELAADLKAKGARVVLVAGNPGEHRETYRRRGVDGFLFRGDDLLASLSRVLRVLGVQQ